MRDVSMLAYILQVLFVLVLCKPALHYYWQAVNERDLIARDEGDMNDDPDAASNYFLVSIIWWFIALVIAGACIAYDMNWGNVH